VITDPEEKIRCPRCGGLDVRHSVPRGFKDSFMMTLGRSPFRCRACQYRFYKSALLKVGEHASDKPVNSGGSKAS
jgi:DNA-directed RNA polymerase subunit RPC12/RpoP